jgi:hypothetical protein
MHSCSQRGYENSLLSDLALCMVRAALYSLLLCGA